MNISVSRGESLFATAMSSHRTAMARDTCSPVRSPLEGCAVVGSGLPAALSYSVDSRRLAPIHSLRMAAIVREYAAPSMIMLLKATPLPSKATHSTELSA